MFVWEQIPSQGLQHHAAAEELFTQLDKQHSENQGPDFLRGVIAFLVFFSLSFIFKTQTFNSLPLSQLSSHVAIHSLSLVLGWSNFGVLNFFMMFFSLYFYLWSAVYALTFSPNFDGFLRYLRHIDLWSIFGSLLSLFHFREFRFPEWFRLTCRKVLYRDRRRVILHWVPDKILRWMVRTALITGEDYRRILYARNTFFMPSTRDPVFTNHVRAMTELGSPLCDGNMEGFIRLYNMSDEQFKKICGSKLDFNLATSASHLELSKKCTIDISLAMELVNASYRAYVGSFQDKLACLWRATNYFLNNFRDVDIMSRVASCFKNIFETFKSRFSKKDHVATGMFADAADTLDGALDWITRYNDWFDAFQRVLVHFVALPILGVQKLLDFPWFEQLLNKRLLNSLKEVPVFTRVKDFVSVTSDFLRVLDSMFNPDDEDARFLASISSVAGWCSEIRYLEGMIGSRSHVPGPGVITFDEFNKRVIACENLRIKYTTAGGPFTACVAEARNRLNLISRTQRSVTQLNTEKPFVVALTGLPGVGKTAMVHHIVAHILWKRDEFKGLTKDEIKGMLFSVIPSDKFPYEGYNPEKHYAVFFDEVGTVMNNSSPIHPAILSVMEHGTHILNQASVEKKGNVIFSSKLIIINNNSFNFGLDQENYDTGITNNGAWFRRIDIHLDCRSLRPEFRKPNNSLGIRQDAPSTLAVGQWRLMGFTNKKAHPVPVKNYGHDFFPWNVALRLLEERYNEYLKKVSTHNHLDSESFESLACCDDPSLFECECCDRCSLCLKTGRCLLLPEPMPCGVNCHWYKAPEDAKLVIASADTSEERSDSWDPRNWWHNFLPTTAGNAFGFLLLSLYGIPFANWTALRFGCMLSFSFATFLYDHTLADALEFRVAQLVNRSYSWALEYFGVRPCTYLKFTKWFLTGFAFLYFSSVTSVTYFCAWWLGTLPTYIWSATLFFLYSLSAWRQFFRVRLARFFPLAFHYYKEKFKRKYGIDPDSIGACVLMFGAFLSGYAIWKTFGPEDKQSGMKKKSVIRQQVDSAIASSGKDLTSSTVSVFDDDRSALSHITPILDVHASRNPWDDGRKVITFSDSRIPLDDLIERCASNQVRMEISFFKDGRKKIDRVGGTALLGSFILTSYHSVRLLARDKSELSISRVINGGLQEVACHRYTTGLESVLKKETLHVDETGDVALLGVKTTQWRDLSKYVVKGCNLTTDQEFDATVVYQRHDGTVEHQTGKARWTHQTVHLDSGEKLYSAWYYLFKPDDSSFNAFMGICGGVMLAHSSDRSCAGIVGLLSVGSRAFDGGREVFMAGALPINQQRVANAVSTYSRAVPASRPDGFPLELEDAMTNKKSHSYYADVPFQYGATEILGFRADARTFPSSIVSDYGWSRDIFSIFPDLQHNYVAPRFGGRRAEDGIYYHPGKHAIMDLKGVCKHYSLVFHEAAFQQLVKDKLRSVDLAPLYTVVPFSSDPSPSLSGIPASMIHQGIKRNTAAGYPWTGKKHRYLTVNADETVTPVPELVDAVQALLAVMSEGRREWLITRGAYKDEPRAKDKVAIRKIRLFNPPDMAHYVVEHLILSPLIQISLLTRGLFHTVGGMNVYSEEWSQIRENLQDRFPCTIPGDFSKFDKGTSFSSMFSTSESDLVFIRSSPYYKGLTKQHQQAFENIFVSLATAMGDVALVVDGEFIAPAHGNGSGSADTYKKNCEVHALIAYECALVILAEVSAGGPGCRALEGSSDPEGAYRLARRISQTYNSSGDRLSHILDHIVFIKHGDDGLYCVTQEYVKLFNFVSFQYGYAMMGVKFTPSDKSDSVFSHKSWDEVDIGKRKWLWNDELQTYLAPLDKSSIGKMLTIGLVSGQTIAEKREVGVEDALREFSQYGRKEYEERRSKLAAVCAKWNVPMPHDRDWKELVLSLRRSREYTVIGDDQELVQAATSAVQTDFCHIPNTIPPEQAQEETTVLNATPSADEPLATILETHATMDSNTTDRIGHSVATSDNINDDPNHQEKVEALPPPTSENVTFVEPKSTYSLDLPSGSDSTFTETDAKDSGFEGFLDRYIELTTVEWSRNTDLLEVIDPWTLWRSNTRIAEKLKHFRYIRFEMEVRFVVNGTPFHYGQLMAAYAPMLAYWGQDFQTGATATANKAKSSLYNFRHYITPGTVDLKETTDGYFSTFPHVMIVPGENTSVQMTLPFIWHNNALRVNYSSMTKSDGTTGMESPGSIVMTDIVTLDRASDTASSKIEISIWARAKNISLNMPTVATSEVKDAEDSGFVSKTASGVATAAKAAGKIPILAPYAKATEVAASTLGNIASLFGFSKPINPSPAENYGVMNARNIAVTNISDNSQKLTFDIHQEITVDSRSIGHDGSDEMSIGSLAKRWWWVGKSPWTPTSSAGVTSFGPIAASPNLIFRALVTPMMNRFNTTIHTTARDAVQLCPAGYVANTFRHWRGSITYRVQVIASQYHKGRLKIQFDPYSASTTDDYVEARYTWILDLSEAREIEVTIPYTNFRPYLEVSDPHTSGTTFDPANSVTSIATTDLQFNENEHMGFLSCSIVNDLVAPNGANGIAHVSVWMRMEDDAEFQVPGTLWHDVVVQATGTSDQVDADEEEEVIGASADPEPMWSVSECPKRNLVFFGERVLSIRSLLKRFVFVTNMGIRESSYKGRSMKIVTIPHWQPPSVSGQGRKNSYQMYFSPGYLARRGSQRFKIYDFTTTNSGTTDSSGVKELESCYNVERRRSSTYVGETIDMERINGTTAVNVADYNTFVASGAAGGAILGRELGSQLVEVESPYYRPTRFDLSVWTDASLSPIDRECDYIRTTGLYLHNDNLSLHTGYYAAAGEDMSLMFFLAAPVLYES